MAGYDNCQARAIAPQRCRATAGPSSRADSADQKNRFHIIVCKLIMRNKSGRGWRPPSPKN